MTRNEEIAELMYLALNKAVDALDEGRKLPAKSRDAIIEEAAHALGLWEERDWPRNTQKESAA
jgi:hypothetical protein